MSRCGGRRLWSWSFKVFINMVRRAAWTARTVRRTVPANELPDDRSTANFRPVQDFYE